MESKGEQISGNPDTVYKNSVFEKMTEQHKNGKMVTYQTRLQFDTLNEDVGAYLIEDGKEEEQIRELMK